MSAESSTAPMDQIMTSQMTAREEKRHEFARLRSVLPSISTQNAVPRIDVLEEAIKYIAHLQAALENHVSTLTTEEVQRRFRESSQTRCVIRCKQRRIPSFHAKLKNAPKPRHIVVPQKNTTRKGKNNRRSNSTT